jgi:hypothetical protein
LGEVETLAGALRLESGWAERKGEGLEDEERPWKLANVGFGSAGLSAVEEAAPKRPVVGFSVGAVVVMAGVVCANAPNPLGLGSLGLSVEGVAAGWAGAPNENPGFCSGGLVAGVVLCCPNPVNPLPKADFVSEGLSGVEVGAVVAALKPNGGLVAGVVVGALPNANWGFDSAGLSGVVAG